MNAKNGFSRRQFIKSNLAAALAASVFPEIIPASALGKDGNIAPSERVAFGAIGVGDRGQAVLRGFLNQPDCQTVALCDVKKDVLAKAKGIVDAKYGNQDCKTYGDFHELVARKDIDAVMIASTDNWHVLHALAAVRAGKDIYVEKPLGLSLAEDQALRREVQKRKRLFQFGTQQRSDAKFRLACELVRNGHIGKLKHINIWAPGSTAGGSTKIVPPPTTMDYDFWLGPAPKREHTEDLTMNANWWYISDFAVGFIAGWGIHPLDIALWGAGDLATGNVVVEGKGAFPTEGLHDTATSWDIDLSFANGWTMKFASSPDKGTPTEELGAEWRARYGKIEGHGTAFEGTEGWIRVHRGSIVSHPDKLIELDQQSFTSKLIHSRDHAGDFIAAVKSRQPTVAPIEDAVKADAFCQVSDIAIRLKRKLTYDTNAEKFIGDKEANQRLALRHMRSPWKI